MQCDSTVEICFADHYIGTFGTQVICLVTAAPPYFDKTTDDCIPLPINGLLKVDGNIALHNT